MAVYDLNDLIESWQSARKRAQKCSDRQQQRLLEHLIEIGGDGEPKSLSWVSRLPSGDGGRRTHELIRLPWASLRSTSPLYITTASVTFDCQMASGPSPSETAPRDLTLIPVSGRKAESPSAHRLEIKLGGGDEGFEEIRLDDHLLKAAGSDAIEIPLEIVEHRPAARHRRRKFSVWKSLTALVLIGLLAAALLWFMGVLPPP
jgi:hypothetical protein